MSKKLTLIVVALILTFSVGQLTAHEPDAKPRKGKRQQQIRKGSQQKVASIDGLLDEMTEAYEQRDGEKMGRLLRRIRQLRKQQRESRQDKASGKQRKAVRRRPKEKSQYFEMDRPQRRSHSREMFRQGRHRQGEGRGGRGFRHGQRHRSCQCACAGASWQGEHFRGGKAQQPREVRQRRDSGRRKRGKSGEDFRWDW